MTTGLTPAAEEPSVVSRSSTGLVPNGKEQKVYFYQSVNKISFNPINRNKICLNGPNGMLMQYKTAGHSIERDGDGGCMDIISVAGTDATFTNHCYSEDGSYLAACTEQGHIMVQKMGPIKLVYEVQFQDKCMVKVQLLQSGELMIAADSQGTLYFFEKRQDESYELVRVWTYEPKVHKSEEEEDEDAANLIKDNEVIRGF